MFGPRGEKLSDPQLWLLELEPSVSAEEVAAEAERPPLEPAAPGREKKKHPGRQKLPENLPRVVTEIACSAEQCQCAARGQEMPVIGHEEGEVLDVEPAKYFVRVTRREKRARQCARGKVVSPALAPRIIEKGLVSDAIVVAVVIGKYSDHRVPRTWRQQCRRGAVREMRVGPSKPEIGIRLQATASCCR